MTFLRPKLTINYSSAEMLYKRKNRFKVQIMFEDLTLWLYIRHFVEVKDYVIATAVFKRRFKIAGVGGIAWSGDLKKD